MANYSYALETMALCTNVKCQDQKDGLVNVVIQCCVLKPSMQNNQRYLVPHYKVKFNCAHCNRELTRDQIPAGTEIAGLPFKASTK